MDESFERRLRALVRMGWWVFGINYSLLLLSWGAYAVFMNERPAWMLALWGTSLSWSTVQPMWVGALVVYKLLAWSQFMAVLWATLWLRSLRRSEAARGASVSPRPLEPSWQP